MGVTTISVRPETKRLLASLKGDKSWDEFLLELAEELRRRRLEEALKKLRQIPMDAEYEEVRLRLGLRGSF
ncbi:MAG: antitoxin VapB family protein [Candidatus Korarchaeota archaeon]|nr:antitoxin VapB family protein [Candidatus Korarchaeota archaeon]